MSEGYINVSVYVGERVMPLPGANVYITQKSDEGAKENLIAQRMTDESGKIKSISIYAPDRENTLEAGEDDVFASVDMYVTHEGYYSYIIHGVQVFSGEVSDQDVSMIPLPEGDSAFETKSIEITAQNL